MTRQENRRTASIGIPSLILIFIVLCLAVFAILTLGNAGREDLFSRKNAAAVQEYYRADAQGEAFLQQVVQALGKAEGISDKDLKKQQVLAQIGLEGQELSDRLCADIEMESGLALRVELDVDWERNRVQVQTWKVYDRENYEIDTSVPVWTGA